MLTQCLANNNLEEWLIVGRAYILNSHVVEKANNGYISFCTIDSCTFSWGRNWSNDRSVFCRKKKSSDFRFSKSCNKTCG